MKLILRQASGDLQVGVGGTPRNGAWQRIIATTNTNTSSYAAHMYTETAVTDVIWVGRNRFQVLRGESRTLN